MCLCSCEMISSGCGGTVKCIETAEVIKCRVTPSLTRKHLLSHTGFLYPNVLLCSYADTVFQNTCSLPL